MSDPRRALTIGTLRLTAKVVEILNALSCVAYRETQPVFSPSVGLLGLLGLCIDLIARCGSYPDCSEEPKEKVAEVRRWEESWRFGKEPGKQKPRSCGA